MIKVELIHGPLTREAQLNYHEADCYAKKGNATIQDKWETGHQQTYSTTGLGMYDENGKSTRIQNLSRYIQNKQN